MKLTSIQRANFAAYLEFEHSRPTWGNLIRRSWRRYAILGVLSVINVGIFLTYFSEEAAAIWSAFIAGILLGDIGSFRRFFDLWPALTQVLDRVRIRELLEADDDDGGKASSR